MIFLCVRDDLETGTDCYIDPSSSDHSINSSSSWLGLLNRGLLRALDWRLGRGSIYSTLWYYACHSIFILILVPWLPHAFPARWFINSHYAHVVLKYPRTGNGWVYLKLFLTVGVVCWNKWPRCWQLKDKKNSMSTIIHWNTMCTNNIYKISIEKNSRFCCVWETDN